MKKYFLTFAVALIIGFFLCNYFLSRYNDYKGIKVSNNGEELYFIQYGVFSSIDSMEENTIFLENYVYNLEDGLYYVYIGITKNDNVALKIVDYYNSLGYKTYTKKYNVVNKEFLSLIDTYDQILLNTEDKTAIASLINQALIKYEEVVISGSKN